MAALPVSSPRHGSRLVPLLLILLALALSACATSRYPNGVSNGVPSVGSAGYVKDNSPSLWLSNHPRVREFRDYYSNTITVRESLNNGSRYLPLIAQEFKRRNLPVELAYLPMLESRFEIRADSGSARGMWQFTRQTARHMGLDIGVMIDERMNWRKATTAAAEYLAYLGREFNYDWALALAAYNGGPNYMKQAIRQQGTRDFFKLRLRRETAEYVPKFVAMLQVAREKYGHLQIASR